MLHARLRAPQASGSDMITAVMKPIARLLEETGISVGELVITVNDPGLPVGRLVGAQPVRRHVETRQFTEPVSYTHLTLPTIYSV